MNIETENKHLPAYPFQSRDPRGDLDAPSEGLTKRELFTAMAMQGLCVTRYTSDDLDIQKLAKKAVMIADETLKQLEK